MQIYFSPELLQPESQVLNIIDQNGKAVGYCAFIFDEKKMYAYGQVEENVSEDFKDLVLPYIKGLSKTKPELDVFSYLTVGGKKLDISQEEGQEG
ncbi:hypothetical protein [Pseudalkalibacillus caeni]|uniref:Uncharacterized protein n=1 Tax=Exobacillus caeni TaxID=2574798 RepID=A0A5R9F3E6_9BACL|nr:hypothetical protein [Pseudalkalibacillus caeni]TLS38127.1 hypothetical protein FCL54_06190 [Pseudalkalibacillus caeni]